VSLEPLLALPAHRRARLLSGLRTGNVAPPYPLVALNAALGRAGGGEAVREALQALATQGLAPTAVATALDAAEHALRSVDRPELVWSGPEVPGVHARDTRGVFEELVDGAQNSIWVSAYTFYDGPKAFKRLAARMDAVPAVHVTLLLNIQRKPNETSQVSDLVMRFADRFWKMEWPGERRPEVFYDPRSLAPQGVDGVLHAKALVVDDTAAFVTSANLTEAAFDRNLELGVLSRDRTLASGLARHFRILIDQERLLPLPTG
jgi:phosphatidylserine/phosphatidylglycerophosphate/cardiolipin synthase-like enzyme